MKIADITSKIQLRDSKPFFDFTKKWIGYVMTQKGSAAISVAEWSELFGKKNPVAGIDRGELLDETKVSNGQMRQTNEKRSIINNWDSSIRPSIEDTIRTTDPSSKIAKIKDLEKLLLTIITKNGGRNMYVAVNRILATFFPDYLVSIPDRKKVTEFIDLIHKFIDNGKTVVKSDNWVDDSYEVKKFFDSELNNDHLTASVWRYYDYLKDNKSNLVNVVKAPTMNTTNKYDEFVKLLLNNHNLILTGAPGTGKTYLAKEIAKAMGAKYKLVQFHPSYDYTDFVEGLRPIKSGSTLGFQRKDGVFKAFCKEALLADSCDFMSLYKAIVDKIKDGTFKTYEADNAGTRLLSYKEFQGVEQIVFRAELEENGPKKGRPKMEGLENPRKMFEILIKENIFDITSYKTEDLYKLVTRATNGETKTVDKAEYIWLLQTLLDLYKEKQQKYNYVLIVDEINRGEASKIFGELFYAIDPGYRGEKGKVDTQYQNLIPKEGDGDFDPTNADVFRDGFYVPSNVYIIGTMNDIDRSVESMDFAMRRRFAWKEITVEERQSMLDEDGVWEGYGKPSDAIIKEMKIRMDNLNAAIIDQYEGETLSSKDKIGLSKAYQIGAAYFLKYALYNNFQELWDNHLEGLLYEYLRGKTNIPEKIARLKTAYNDTTQHIDNKRLQ